MKDHIDNVVKAMEEHAAELEAKGERHAYTHAILLIRVLEEKLDNCYTTHPRD